MTSIGLLQTPGCYWVRSKRKKKPNNIWLKAATGERSLSQTSLIDTTHLNFVFFHLTGTIFWGHVFCDSPPRLIPPFCRSCCNKKSIFSQEECYSKPPRSWSRNMGINKVIAHQRPLVGWLNGDVGNRSNSIYNYDKSVEKTRKWNKDIIN